MTNLNLLFNKTYYSELGKDESSFSKSLERHNKKIFNTVFDHKNDYRPSKIASENDVNDGKKGIVLLKTVYPGLLVGSGNPHGSHQSNDDINLGFSFDYVSGQPYIPGSSVKGILRSKFKQCPEAVAEILKTVLEVNLGEDEVRIIKVLETDIFEGKDVFLDAVVYDGEPINGRLMGPDYITPHSSPIKNPVPVLFVKLLPEVRFEFRFKLYDSEIENVKITAGKKKHLFKELLKFFGVGAKTNVGYGNFEDCDDRIFPKAPIREAVQHEQVQTPQNDAQKPEFKKCKVCGKRIYKYRLDGTENKAWKYDTCFNCK